MNIAEKLQNLRKRIELSQEKLIEELEKTQGVKIAISSLRNYENVNKPRIPKNEILNALANFYNVDIEYLLNDSAENITKENIKINKVLELSDEAIENIKEVNKKGFSEYLDILLNDKKVLQNNVVNLARYRFLYILQHITLRNVRNSIIHEKYNLSYTRNSLNDCIKVLKNFDEFELIFIIKNLISILEGKTNVNMILRELDKIDILLEDRMTLTEYYLKENTKRYLSQIKRQIREKTESNDDSNKEGENNEHKGNRKK